MSEEVELWQLYDEQGRSIANAGATKDDVQSKGLLHAVAHVWIWRQADENIEVLLQQRAFTKKTWPGLYDISAAGHIRFDESPLEAAIREIQEEVGYEAGESELNFVGIERQYLVDTQSGRIENEFAWLYLLKASEETSFTVDSDEVESLVWKPVEEVRNELAGINKDGIYAPHDETYFNVVFQAIERTASGFGSATNH